jgi:MoaA/NifB/PqqE/SkfB family radical SAM enzyme
MEPPEVRFGSILINPKCSNNCVFCKPSNSIASGDLTKEQEKILFGDTLQFINEGIENIDISGSEPLNYSKIIEYLLWIRPRFKRIIVLDPGNRLSDPNFASRFAAANIDKIILPIYGSDASHHDKIVGNPGAFEKLIRGILNLQQLKKGPRIELTSLILKQNLDSGPHLHRVN